MPIKLLLNNKEIANFLVSNIDFSNSIKDIEFSTPATADAIIFVQSGLEKRKGKKIDDLLKKKYRDKIIKGVSKDLRNYLETAKTALTNKKTHTWETIHKKIDYILENLGEHRIIELYKQSKNIGFVKGCGLNIDPGSEMIRRHRFNNFDEDCLIRNTVGNENLLVTKIDKARPFWFIDSGYTNFLEPNKKWHRLVRNHLHYGKYFDAPVDRLGNFRDFPKQWRQGGDIIYVIEPGSFAADIFHVNLKTWKYEIEKELREYTDKKIKFREKAPKKERTNLYQELADDDYYCLICINSNAATEAIWQGVPAITLDKHITNPVTANKISDINNLYRGRIADWLCMLSYSQFTYDELTNGTAFQLLKKYHG
jgi:hypothetical protein